jgi:hypothetical protein
MQRMDSTQIASNIVSASRLQLLVEGLQRVERILSEAGKLPVRGKFRVACLLIGSAAVSNVRRIQRYLVAKSKAEMAQPVAPGTEKCTQQAGDSFWAFPRTTLAALCGFASPKILAVSC